MNHFVRDNSTNHQQFVLVISAIWPPEIGGSGTYIAGLISKLGRPTIVLAPKVDAQVKDEASPQQTICRIFGLHRLKGGLFKIGSILHQADVIVRSFLWIATHRKQPSLVICNQILFSGIVGLVWHCLFKTPYIVVAYGEELTMWRKTPWRKWLASWVMRPSAQVIAISTFARDQVLSYQINPGRVRVICPGLDIPAYHIEQVEIQQRLAGVGLADQKFILMAGRLVLRKGFDKAIDALPAILSSKENIKLVIVGKGPEQPYLRKLVKHHDLDGQVIFLGQVEQRTLLALYASCEFFLLPNRQMPDGDTEGFGIVFLEASLMGRPAVGGKDGGAVDAIRHGESGLIVDGNDPRQIVQAALSLLEHSEWADELGRRGRSRVLGEFDVSVLSQYFASIVESIIHERISCKSFHS